MSETILQRVATGDQAAVSECLTRYGGLVWSLARRLLRNVAEAEDAVQEVFVELWRNASRFDPAVAKESTFVSMLARRRLIDRRRRLDRVPDPMPFDERDPSDPGNAPGHAIEVSDEADRVREAWKTLRDEEREILELAIHGGLSHAEIAERCDLPLGTVKTRARKGLRELRDRLRREVVAHHGEVRT